MNMTTTIEKKFEAATRLKLRFSFKGLITVEDLWDLQLEHLDAIYKTLNKEAKLVNEESLLETKTKKNEELDLKIDIVKHVVEVKLEEKNKKLKEKELKEQKQKILEVLSDKENKALETKSPEELKAMLEELEKSGN